jgi:hypothetical protein
MSDPTDVEQAKADLMLRVPEQEDRSPTWRKAGIVCRDHDRLTREVERLMREREGWIGSDFGRALVARAAECEERAARAEKQLAEAQFQLKFLTEIGPEKDGWCGEHERRYAANSNQDGDECQFCRADDAEAKLAKVVEAADIELAFGDKLSRAQLHAALAAARGDSTEQGGPDV